MIDDQGYLVFRGRIKEMIKSGGINISPAEIEDFLRTHPAVDQALVVGVPDEALDEAAVAVVVLKRGRDETAETFVSFCRQELSKYKVPKRFVFRSIEEIPLMETGKPDKRTLQRELTQAGVS